MAEVGELRDTGVIEAVLEGQRKRFLDPRVASSFRGWNKTMLYHFLDREEYFSFRFVDGVPEPAARGKVEGAEIVYEMDTETFCAITSGQISGLKAWQQKKVKLRASVSDMLKLQKVDSI
jgi:hypothetical protein